MSRDSSSSALSALVLASPQGEERIVSGIDLGERGRRVAARAGVAADRVHLVRSPDDLAAATRALGDGPLVVLDARGQVVAGPLVQPLLDAARAAPSLAHLAVDAASGAFAGGLVVPATLVTPLVATVVRDPARGLDTFVGDLGEVARRHPVNERARHPARTREEVRAADAWQFELVNKSLDAPITRYFYRPLARPLTKLFLRTPLTPNHITLISTVFSLGGCWLAAGPGYTWHVVGLALLVVGGIIDCNDGEVARLRLEFSELGGWLDTAGDDAARVSLLLAMGAHIAPRYPDWPIMWITIGALVLTLVTMSMIYWYCITIAHSSNSQEYTRALGVGPGVSTGAPSLGARVSDVLSQLARRDAMDLLVLVLAIVNVPEVGWFGLVAGGAIGLVWVLPTHVKLVRRERAKRAAAAA